MLQLFTLFNGALLNVSLADRLMQKNVLLGIALAVVGVFLSTIATRLARAIRKTNDLDPNDKIIITMKSLGLILILIALIIMVIE